jgi:hypothetical protein
LDSTDSKHKLEVTRLGQVVQNRFQKMNMKKIKTKNKVSKFVKNEKYFFFQKLGYSFWGSGSAERKKEWNMARMIINEKLEPKKDEPGWLSRSESKK